MSFVGGRDYRTRSCVPAAGRMIMSVPSLSRLSHGFVQPRGEAIKFDPQPALSMPQGLHPEPARTSQATCLRPHLGRCDESGRLYEGIRSGRRESAAGQRRQMSRTRRRECSTRRRTTEVVHPASSPTTTRKRRRRCLPRLPTSKPERSATNTRSSRFSSSRV